MRKKNAVNFWKRYAELTEKDLPITIVTGIPQSTLSTWKNKNIFPRVDEAFKIAQVLKTTVEYLVSGNKSET